jgi:hypothetical protein
MHVLSLADNYSVPRNVRGYLVPYERRMTPSNSDI